MSSTLSRLEAAEQRLDDALARFETALARADGRPPSVNDPGGDALRDECARLTQALGEVRQRNEELRNLSHDAATRLDSAIAQIDLLLEE